MTRLILHVGYPKTASSFLQKCVFPEQDELRFINHTAFLDDLFKREQSRGETWSRLRKVMSKESRPVLISEESICISPRWMQRFNWKDEGLLTESEIYEQFTTITSDITILIVVREQRDWIKSWHQERVKKYERRTLGKLLLSELFLNDIRNELLYARKISRLKSIFGADRVKVLFYEDLVTDSKCFQEKLFLGMGIKGSYVPNEKIRLSLSPVAVEACRLSNFVLAPMKTRAPSLSSLERNLFRLSRRLISLDYGMPMWFRKFEIGKWRLSELDERAFREDNIRLMALLSESLTRRGYLV